MGYIVDTYAFIEWFEKNNQNYKEYFDKKLVEEGAYITPLILMELFFLIHRDKGEEKAKEFLKILNKYFKIIKVKQKTLIETSIFRSQMYKKSIKMSYVDCMSCVLAKELKLKILTGDEHFRSLPNVEFIK
ncbi:MAG: PIN domain-containing protein [Candidatus Woesearchaeota archaeon]|nr:PIN domain-containing protein [Candidatus Woesearchaeota archaeon]